MTAVNSSRAAVKPTITRVAKNAAAAKTSTPEQKIAALTRQGNLKITRKVVNTPINANTQQPISVHGGEEFNLNESFASNVATNDDQQQVPIVATQILGQVDASSGQSVALIDASHLEHGVNEIKKEGGEDIVMNADQLHQLQQSGGIVTDQESFQQILAASDDGGQQLIQFVTGEDGTIYQVAGKNEQGQTILIAQGADGEQQCVYVAAEDSEALGLGLDDANNGNVLSSIDGNLVANAEVQQHLQQQLAEGQQSIQFGTDDATAVQGVHQPLAVATEDSDSQDGQITAEVVQADLPSPGTVIIRKIITINSMIDIHSLTFKFAFVCGYVFILGGTRRVILQLPDGNFMITEVDEEQFKALNMQG